MAILIKNTNYNGEVLEKLLTVAATSNELVEKGLQVIDSTASVMCLENRMPLLVFGLGEENSIIRAASGEKIGTKVYV